MTKLVNISNSSSGDEVTDVESLQGDGQLDGQQ